MLVEVPSRQEDFLYGNASANALWTLCSVQKMKCRKRSAGTDDGGDFVGKLQGRAIANRRTFVRATPGLSEMGTRSGFWRRCRRRKKMAGRSLLASHAEGVGLEVSLFGLGKISRLRFDIE